MQLDGQRQARVDELHDRGEVGAVCGDVPLAQHLRAVRLEHRGQVHVQPARQRDLALEGPVIAHDPPLADDVIFPDAQRGELLAIDLHPAVNVPHRAKLPQNL